MIKFISVSLIVLGLGLAAFYIFLNVQFSNTMPRESQPNLGRTYPLNNHGTVVYLNRQEHWELECLSDVALACCILGGLLFYNK